jgi:mannose-6-phosphate isomerase-like protein (cupin superfamily)
LRARTVAPQQWSWITRPHEPGEPARHVAELSEALDTGALRANVWRYEPGAAGVRHRQRRQDELFFVLEGTLTIYLGEPPSAAEVPRHGAVHVPAGTPVQSANHGSVDLLVAAIGTPPEVQPAELLPSAIPASRGGDG